MARFQQFRVDELDDVSREYLIQASSSGGRGMPGVYFPKTNVAAIIAFVFGIAILIATLVIAFPPLEEPLASAMLQTAGLLAGGWCLLAALRLWGVFGSSSNLGRFLYIDADQMWEVSGSKVNVVSIRDLYFVDAEHQNNNGTYQRTDFLLRMGSGEKTFSISNGHQAERLYLFLNILLEVRKRTAETAGESGKRYSSALEAGIALTSATGISVPDHVTTADLGLAVSEIPQPQKTKPASSGFLACLVIVALGAVSILVFKHLNVGWRDDAVFQRIQEITHVPARAPWLRAYLADARNVRHRDEAQRELDSIYNNVLDRLKNSWEQFEVNGRIEMRPAIDPAMYAAFATLLHELKTRPQPVISIRVAAKDEQNQAAHIENQVHTAIFSRFENAVGKELVLFLKAPDGIPGLIEFHWKVEQTQALHTTLLWTIAFRKTPDAEATQFQYRTRHNNAQVIVMQAMEGANEVMRKIVGTTIAPAPPLDVDF